MSGYQLTNFCEIDKFATKAYCAIHGVDESLNLNDVSTINTDNIADFSMLCGGSPCVDFSTAGLGVGAIWTCKSCGHNYNPLEQHFSKRDYCPICNSNELEKTRSSLIVEYLRVLRGKLPKFAIYENVKNIIGKTFKPTFDLFIKELQEYGYNTYYKVLNAKDYGVPQNRERIYVLSIRKDIDNGKFKFPQPFDSGLRLVDFLEKNVDDKWYLSEESVERYKLNVHNKSAVLFDPSQSRREGQCRAYTNYAPCLNARDTKEPRLINDNMIHQVGNLVKDDPKFTNPQRGRVYLTDGIAPTLDTKQSSKPNIIVDADNADNNNNDTTTIKPINLVVDNCGTILARYGNVSPANLMRDSSFGATGVTKISNSDPTKIRIRKLTPRECYRLMGFGDDDFDKAQSVISNHQLYKTAGNSIVVDVLYYIYVELYKAMPYLFDDLKLNSLFSGIGAFETALDRLYDAIANNDPILNNN